MKPLFQVVRVSVLIGLLAAKDQSAEKLASVALDILANMKLRLSLYIAFF